MFKRIDDLQAALKQELETVLNSMLESTTGQEQIRQFEATIALAKAEQQKYEPGSYTYNLIAEDISRQEERLARFKQETGSVAVEAVIDSYQQRILYFLDFLNVMQGRYEQATFQEKRNAIEVLGVRVVVHEPIAIYGLSADGATIGDEQEWFSAKEAARILGVTSKTIHRYRHDSMITRYKEEQNLLVHRDELVKLQERGFLQRNTEEIVRSRVEISYAPPFVGEGNSRTSVPASL